MSASTLRASIDSSTDLPTPEPAKMPSRWPRQQVRNVLSARTPRSSGGPTRLRECAGGGELRYGIGEGPCGSGPLPSIGSPIALRTRPSQERRRPHLACGIGDHGAAAAPDAFETGERHHHGIVAGEADHLGRDETVAAGLDHDAGADRHRMDGAGDLDHQAAHADHAAIDIDAVDVVDLFGERLHCENLKFPRFWPGP